VSFEPVIGLLAFLVPNLLQNNQNLDKNFLGNFYPTLVYLAITFEIEMLES